MAGLVRLLSYSGVRLANWPTEDIAILWREIETGESLLLLRNGVALVRHVCDVRALVQFTCVSADGENYGRDVYTLFERTHTSPAGARRSSVSRLSYSLGVHMRAGEQQLHPMTTLLRRVMRETLGVSGMPLVVSLSGTGVEAGLSPPGLVSEIEFRLYTVVLDERQFEPAGYVCRGVTPPRRFIWEKASDGGVPGKKNGRGRASHAPQVWKHLF